jgi:hypothetical protein
VKKMYPARDVSIRSQNAFWSVLCWQMKWRINFTTDWETELSKLQKFTPTMKLQPKRISLVIARTGTVDGHVSTFRHYS